MILGIAEIAVYFLFSVFFYATGEMILFVATIGKYRPVWKKRVDSRIGEFVILSEFSFWVGIAFWLLVGYFAWWLLAN